jgi:maltose alpha-D-glucosyltransferase/alpha-amylase
MHEGGAALINRWYQDGIFYCLDVETYADSNGDGIGDFNGLTSRLAHIAGLGFSCIWLLPFFPTPNRDNGYDIIDYYGVDPRLGTLGDFVEFTRQAHDRGLRVVIDLVVNHTSDQHPWFQQARSSPDSPFREFYIWSKSKPEDANQGMVFPGQQESIWTYDRQAKEYYYHRFFPHQPDLNISSPKVRAEIAKIMSVWLELGVDGFRIDAAPFLIEQRGVNVEDIRDPYEYINEMHALLSWRSKGAILLAEANVDADLLPQYFGDGDRMHMLFNFILNQLTYVALAREEAEPITRALRMLPSKPAAAQWAVFMRNHDELALERLSERERADVSAAFGLTDEMWLYDRGVPRRLPPMLGGDQRRLRQAYSMLFSLPGTPVVWYGEEIGMGDDLSQPERNAVRAPMQWSAEANAGFSTAPAKQLVRPVISKGQFGYQKLNVAAQQREGGSLLNLFEQLIRVRRQCPEIGRGTVSIIDTGQASVLGLRYKEGQRELIVLHNLSRKACTATIDLKDGEEYLTDLLDGYEHVPAQGPQHQVEMEAYGCRWLRVNGER